LNFWFFGHVLYVSIHVECFSLINLVLIVEFSSFI